MPLYLTRATYSPETWAKLIARPEDRRAAARAEVESVGGKLHGVWYSLGSHDLYVLREVPDTVSMAAIAARVASLGAVQNLETIPLLSVEEMLDALATAATITYTPPGDDRVGPRSTDRR